MRIVPDAELSARQKAQLEPVRTQLTGKMISFCEDEEAEQVVCVGDQIHTDMSNGYQGAFISPGKWVLVCDVRLAVSVIGDPGATGFLFADILVGEEKKIVILPTEYVVLDSNEAI